jgi:predicted O-methyltransferase YrrM
MRAKGRITIDWLKFFSYVTEIRGSDFQKQVLSSIGNGASGLMGDVDTIVLYAIVRFFKPKIVVESGSGRGKSSSFIIKAMEDNVLEDETLADSTLIGIEPSRKIEVGGVIPEYLRHRFRHLDMTVQTYSKGLPEDYQIDMFLHDSVHRYNHQLWEFETFWPYIRQGGILASHDILYNQSFVDFISSKYVLDGKGITNFEASEFGVWSVTGNLGFILKR